MEKVKHFLKLVDLSIDELSYLFDRAKIIKASYKSYKKTWTLEDRTLVMIFEKDEIELLFDRAKWIKDQYKSYKKYWPLEDRTLVMIF